MQFRKPKELARVRSEKDADNRMEALQDTHAQRRKNLENAAEDVEAFHRENPGKVGPRRSRDFAEMKVMCYGNHVRGCRSGINGIGMGFYHLRDIGKGWSFPHAPHPPEPRL